MWQKGKEIPLRSHGTDNRGHGTRCNGDIYLLYVEVSISIALLGLDTHPKRIHHLLVRLLSHFLADWANGWENKKNFFSMIERLWSPNKGRRGEWGDWFGCIEMLCMPKNTKCRWISHIFLLFSVENVFFTVTRSLTFLGDARIFQEIERKNLKVIENDFEAFSKGRMVNFQSGAH